MKRKPQPSYRPRNRVGRTIIPVLSLTLLTVVLAAGIAGVWQLLDTVPYSEPDVNPFARPGASSSSSSSQTSSVPDRAPLVDPAGSSKSASSQSLSASDSSESQPPPEAEPGVIAYQVPKGEWTPSEYFDDAVFVGDSLTEGIKHYDVMSNTTVLAGTGVNLDSIYTKEVIKTGQGDAKISIMDALAAAKPAKIYIMMGANSLDYSEEDFVKGYARIIDSVKEMHPDSVIYVQSIMPVTKAYADSRPNFGNDRIDRINGELSRMAQDKGVNYVYVADAVKDETGALPSAASADGIHFGTTYYRMWFDYLREHTVAP